MTQSKQFTIKSSPLDPITGRYLRHGNGCRVCNNCFACPPEYENKCHYGSALKEDGNVLSK